MINIKNINPEDVKLGVLGAGKSGLSVSKLAKYLGFNILLSESNKPQNELDLKGIDFEVGGHTDKILDSDLIIKSPGIPNDISIIKKAIKKNIPIISEVEFASWFSDSPIIGVTGTNGKTTTVNLIHNIFLKAGFKSMLGGNVGIPFSDNVYKEILSENQNRIHILELSSFQLEHIPHLSLDVACILNISRDHLDRYNSFEKYIDTKLNIIKAVKSNGFIIFNNDDSILKEKIINKDNTIPFSYKDVQSEIFKLDEIHLRGIHNHSNISAALAVSKICNIDFEIFIKSIKDFKPLPHRIEYILTLNKTKIYNDSKSTNIDSMSVAIDAFNQNIVIIVGGVDKESSNFLNIFRQYSNKITHVVCYGESGQLIFNQIKNHIKSSYNKNFEISVSNALSKCKGDDVLLFSPGCASYDQFKNYIDRGNKFKEIIFGLS
tara:strand:+ start:186 stop:1487 length:1302 start_codon:yes stop_codon:yes gene_type:complete